MNSIITTSSLFSGPDDNKKSSLKHNEHNRQWVLSVHVSVSFLNTFSRGTIYRGCQSANTTVIVENLTVKLYPWDEEIGQCPMNVSEIKSIYKVL